jgi:hypothetical protein
MMSEMVGRKSARVPDPNGNNPPGEDVGSCKRWKSTETKLEGMIPSDVKRG